MMTSRGDASPSSTTTNAEIAVMAVFDFYFLQGGYCRFMEA